MVYYLCESEGGEISTAGFDTHESSYAGRAEWVDLSLLDEISPAASYDWRTIVRQAVDG